MLFSIDFWVIIFGRLLSSPTHKTLRSYEFFSIIFHYPTEKNTATSCSKNKWTKQAVQIQPWNTAPKLYIKSHLLNVDESPYQSVRLRNNVWPVNLIHKPFNCKNLTSRLLLSHPLQQMSEGIQIFHILHFVPPNICNLIYPLELLQLSILLVT